MEKQQYERSWEWLRNNVNGTPLPAVAYVAVISVGVGAKNALSEKKYDVYVETAPNQLDVMDNTVACFPRVCIVKRAEEPLEAVAQHLNNFITLARQA